MLFLSLSEKLKKIAYVRFLKKLVKNPGYMMTIITNYLYDEISPNNKKSRSRISFIFFNKALKVCPIFLTIPLKVNVV